MRPPLCFTTTSNFPTSSASPSCKCPTLAEPTSTSNHILSPALPGALKASYTLLLLLLQRVGLQPTFHGGRSRPMPTPIATALANLIDFAPNVAEWCSTGAGDKISEQVLKTNSPPRRALDRRSEHASRAPRRRHSRRDLPSTGGRRARPRPFGRGAQRRAVAADEKGRDGSQDADGPAPRAARPLPHRSPAAAAMVNWLGGILRRMGRGSLPMARRAPTQNWPKPTKIGPELLEPGPKWSGGWRNFGRNRPKVGRHQLDFCRNCDGSGREISPARPDRRFRASGRRRLKHSPVKILAGTRRSIDR